MARRRLVLALSVATGLLAAVAGCGSSPKQQAYPTHTSTAGCTVSAILVPSCGVWWGAYQHPSGSEDWTSAVTNLESAAGQSFGIVYRYHDFSGQLFPDASDEQLASSGHVLVEDWGTRIFSTNEQLQWSAIAAGQYDASVIIPEAQHLKAYGKPVILSFDHEMDAHVPEAGQPADYVAAYRHIWNTFASMHVTNVIWLWTITGYPGHDAEYKALYPGNSYVDWIGYDPYNFGACHRATFRSFEQTIDPAYQWLEKNGFGDKPFMLPEYGTVADPSDPSAAAKWYAEIPSVLASHPNIKAMLEWDDAAAGCSSELTGPGELAAFANAGRVVASPSRG